jgi:hypothetical protein
MSERILDVLRTRGDPSPTLENLELNNSDLEDLDCSQIARLFPNLSSLRFESVVISDISPLNSLKQLTTLKLNHVDEQMLEELDVKGLSRIYINCFPDVDIEVFEKFTRKHGDLRHLELTWGTIEQLQIIAENLAKLEFLSVRFLSKLTDDNEKLAIQTIGKLYEKLDKIDMVVRFKNPEVIADFKILYPGMPIAATENGRVFVRKSIDWWENRPLWSRKNLKSFYETLK